MTKQQLIQNFVKETYCKIGISSIEGVGVIAIRNIPKGTNPYFGSFKGKYIRMSKDEIVSIPENVQRLLQDFFVTENEYVWIPTCGLNGMDISFFMNHSEEPNVVSDELGESFITVRDIKEGEELTINYNECYGNITYGTTKIKK